MTKVGKEGWMRDAGRDSMFKEEGERGKMIWLLKDASERRE